MIDQPEISGAPAATQLRTLSLPMVNSAPTMAAEAEPGPDQLLAQTVPDGEPIFGARADCEANLRDDLSVGHGASQRLPATATVKKHVILFLAANPSATDRLALDHEARAIHLELKRSGFRDRFDFVTRWAVEPLDLLRELRELRPTVVHFSGHRGELASEIRGSVGVRDVVELAPSAAESHGLCFHDAAGGAQVVSPAAIVHAFGAAGASVKLVVLAACFTEPIAEALLTHIGCVIGMSGAIRDDAARSFAIGFYGGLGEHESIAAAYEQGRAAIRLDGLADAERPRIKSRDGFDPTRVILAAIPSALRREQPCPYPGMRPYTANDAAGFHGREAETKELLSRLRAGEREIYVIGPSGSGKSSLVAAGVLPRIARGAAGLGPFIVRALRPGEQPAARLSQTLEVPLGTRSAATDHIAALLAHRGPGLSLLVVIDQLEELFTLASADEREAFFATLRVLREEARCFMIFTLRADFFGALMTSPLWTEHRGQLSRIEMIPLRGQALREAISAPAGGMGVPVEPELIERLMADAASEPGILPLLQETMVQLWDARVNQTLTLADYRKLGEGDRNGLAVALTRRADATLRKFKQTQEGIVLRIMLRLVTFGEGRADTRRQQPISALRSTAESPVLFEAVLQQLVNDRLLIMTADHGHDMVQVDLAHEVLINAWSTFATWIKTWRVHERHRRRLEEAAAAWIVRGCGEGGLLDEIELAGALAWRQQAASELGESVDMASFIDASKAARVRLGRLHRRRLQLTLGALIGFLTITSIFGLVARNERVRSEKALVSARAQHARAEAALENAEKRKRELVLLQAETALAKDPTAALAWLKSYDVAVEGRGHLVDMVDEALALGVARHVFRPGDWVLDSRFTADGRSLVAAARDGMIRRYDLVSGAEFELGQAPSPPYALALTPDGELAITGGAQGEVMAWPLCGGPPRVLVHTDNHLVSQLRLSPDGRMLLIDRNTSPPQVVALAGGEPTALAPPTGIRYAVAAENWSRVVMMTAANEIAVPGERVADPARVLVHIEKAIAFFAISPRGDTVLVHDGTTLWLLPFTGGPLHELTRYGDKLATVAWSVDGRTLAIGGHRPEIVVVDLATGRTTELRGHSDAIYAVEFTRGGTRLLSASDDATARLWTLSTHAAIVLRGHDDDVFRAHLSADERSIVTSSLDGSARVWAIDSPSAVVYVERAPIEGMRFDGGDLVVRTATTVARWSLASGAREAVSSWADEPHTLGYGIASYDGQHVVIPSPDGSLELRVRGRAPVVLHGHRRLVTHVEFSRDGRAVYSSSADGTLWRWDADTGAGAVVLETAAPIRGFAVARDGRVAAQAGDLAYLIDPASRVTKLGKGGVWCVDFAEFEPVTDRLIIHRCDNHLAIVEGGRQIELSTGGYSASRVAVSPDGRWIAGALVDRTIRLWSTETGALLDVLHGHTDVPLDVAFSPDGKLLASASWDKTIRLWDLETKHHRVLRGHTAEVTRVVWRDAGHLASGSSDGAVRLWDVPNIDPSMYDTVRRLREATSAQIVNDRPTSVGEGDPYQCEPSSKITSLSTHSSLDNFNWRQ